MTTQPAAPTASTRIPGHELRDGDRVYVTGRWQVLSGVRHKGDNFRANTDRGGAVFANALSLYDVAR